VIVFESVSKRYGDGTLAIDQLDLTFVADQITALVGPPRCGRSTVLRLIDRLEDPTAGRVLLDGQDVNRMDPVRLRRGMAHITNEAGLFPHRTIGENLAHGPRLVGWDRQEIATRVGGLLEQLGLDPFVTSRYPHELSALETARVALGAAMAADPAVALLDDPFRSLPSVERAALYRDLVALERKQSTTMIIAIDNIADALAIADRIVVLAVGGRLAQEGTPIELLTRPIDDVAAEVIGEHRGLARLALFKLDEVRPTRGPVVTPDATADDARAAAETGDSSWVLVVRSDDSFLGWADTARLSSSGRVTDTPLLAVEQTVGRWDSLLTALDQMVTSPSRMAVWTDGDGRLGGVITRAVLDPHLPIVGAGG